MSTFNDDWHNKLSKDQYRVAREGGTEAPFSGQYYQHKENGSYQCICCHADLFSSTQKYDSGSGWPSFWAPANDNCIREVSDNGHGMVRVEVRCKQCAAHLGHVFEDGPQPTGLRYCINSLSLDFSTENTKTGMGA